MFSHTILYRALVAAGARAASNFHTVAATSPTPTTDSQSSSSFNNSSSASRLSSSYPQQQDSTPSSSSDYNNNDDQNNNNSSSSSSTSPEHQENQAAVQASATQLMRFRIPKPEQFYFSRGDSICRLCNEFVSSQQVKFHLVGAGPRGPSTHMGREIILDSLVYYGKLGYDPAVVMRSWAFTMLSHPQYVRLPELLPNKQDPTDLEARAKKCHELLQSLKKLKVIDISVSPHSEVGRTEHATRMAVKRRVAFERFECIGDNAWGSHLSGRMLLLFPDKKWAHAQMHHSFNTFRDLVETNTNLERCFDLLNIAELLPPTSRAIVGDGKIKADIFEAILGELNCALYAHEANLWGTSEEYTELNDEHLARTCIIIKHVMNEIFDLTLLSMMYLLGEHAIGIARELSMGGIMNMNIAPSRPPFDAGDTIRTRRPHYHKNYVPTFTLPSVMQQLTDEPQYTNNTSNINTCYRTHKINFKKYGPAINMTARSKYLPSWKSFVEQERRQKILNDARILAATTATTSSTDHQISMMSLSEKPTTAPKGQRMVATTTTTTTQPPLQQVFGTNSDDGGSDPSSTSSSSSLSKDQIVDEGVILRELSSPSLDLCFGIQRHMSSGDNDTQSIIINNNNNNNNNRNQDHSPPSSSVEQATASNNNISTNSSYRSICPFTKLSKYPPHIYNPYGLDDKTWTDRWMKEEHAKEFFEDDVCDNIGTVLAQFEATAAFGNMMTSNSSTTSTQQKGDDNDYHAKREEEGKKLLRGSRSYEGMVDHVFDRLTVREEAEEEEEETHEEELSSASASASFYQNISYIRDELLEYIHPFKNGVTVGTDGASFTSLSGSITEVTTNLAAVVVVGRGETSSSSSSTTTTSTTEDAKFKMTSTDQKPTIGGKLDIDEIKRRNAMRTGQKMGSVRRF